MVHFVDHINVDRIELRNVFASYSTVEIKLTKERKSMNNFKIGDQELVDINNHNQRIYELVYSFIHASPNRLYDYLKISVENISE